LKPPARISRRFSSWFRLTGMDIRPVLALVLFVSATSLLPAQSGDSPYVIRDIRVFDGETVAERQTVVINEGRIAAVGGSIVAVPAGAQEIAGEGRTLLPGLIDAHIHLPFVATAEALQQTLAFGVTTAVVMWAAAPIVSQVKAFEAADRPDVAAVINAGTGATAPGGHPTQMDGGAQARFVPTLSSPSEADAFVAARVAEGSEFIKIIYDDTSDAFGRKLPTLNEETVAALATAAHARRRIAVAHIGNERYARGAISAGVDGLAHLFVGPAVSSDFGQFAASHGVFVIPTLSVLYSVCGTPDGPSLAKEADTMRYVKPQFRSVLDMPAASSKLSCDAAPQAIRQLSAAGVALLAGTDSPAPGTTYGASLHRELEHLVNTGLTPAAALAAATSATARAFRINDRGRIRTGMQADLLLVDGDPSKQIRATRNIVAIWKRGVRVQRAP
jgi:imidazolonepropionase-like amidohydrolase